MTIAELVNSVDISKGKKRKEYNLVTAKTLCAVIFGIQAIVILWHASYWF